MVRSIQQGSVNISKRTSVWIRLFTYIYVLLSFFEPYLNGALGSLTKYYIFALMGLICVIEKKLFLFRFHGCFIVWLGYKIISTVWTTNMYIPRLHLINHIGMVALLIVLTGISWDKQSVEDIVKMMWMGSALIGLLSLRFSHPYHGVVMSRRVLYLFGQEMDPNNQAVFLLVGIAISIYFLMIEKSYKIIALFVMFINAYSMLLTGSRGGLVGVVCVILVMYLYMTRDAKVTEKISVLAAMTLILIIGFQIAIKFLPQDTFLRLFTFSSYEGGSDRDIIWKNGLNLLFLPPHLLTGAGWGAYYGYNGISMVMHNTYLSMLCDVGIIGVVLFFAPIVIASRTLLKQNIILPLLIIVSVFIPCFFIEAINKRFFWNAILVLFIYYANLSIEKIKKNDA